MTRQWSDPAWRSLFLRLMAVAALACITEAHVLAQATDTLSIRGHAQTVHLYGSRKTGDPVIVSSGDGGWIHLGPHVAETLAARGFFVVGFDVKAYLSSFTWAGSTLSTDEASADYRVLAEYAARGSVKKPILVGVSEGAGLSVLAAADPVTKTVIAGVIGLGLPDRNELGWRWKDSLIYLTHGVPNEPTFSAAAIVERVAPLPLAVIHSTHDEFVSVAEAQRTLGRAGQPKRLWTVEAADHRFSNNLSDFDRRLLEAIAWISQNQLQ